MKIRAILASAALLTLVGSVVAWAMQAPRALPSPEALDAEVARAMTATGA
jgi:hypothetical protein